jgi:hypothetical protein
MNPMACSVCGRDTEADEKALHFFAYPEDCSREEFAELVEGARAGQTLIDKHDGRGPIPATNGDLTLLMGVTFEVVCSDCQLPQVAA